MSNQDTLRDAREPGFIIIDNEVIDDYGQQIGPYGLAVYGVLLRFANQYGTDVFPAYQTIADKLGMSRPTVFKAIKVLVDAGLVRKQSRRNKFGGTTSNEYTILPVKKNKSKDDAPQTHVNEVDWGDKPDLRGVVNEVDRGSKPDLQDQDPIKKIQLNKRKTARASTPHPVSPSAATQTPAPVDTVQDIQPTLLPVSPTPLPEPTRSRGEPEAPAASPVAATVDPTPAAPTATTAATTKAILDAYVEVRGKEGVHYAKEGCFAKKIAADGFTPEQVKGCYAWMKLDKFWADKRLGLSTIYENLPEYKAYLEKVGSSNGTTRPATRPSLNGNQTAAPSLRKANFIFLEASHD